MMVKHKEFISSLAASLVNIEGDVNSTQINYLLKRSFFNVNIDEVTKILNDLTKLLKEDSSEFLSYYNSKFQNDYEIIEGFHGYSFLIEKIVFPKFENEISQLSDDEKNQIISELYKLCTSDGVLSENEQYILNLVSDLLSVSYNEIISSTLSNPFDNDNIHNFIQLSKNDIENIFKNSQEYVKKCLSENLEKQIEEKIGVKNLDLEIKDLFFSNDKKVTSEILFDQRTININEEINYSGFSEKRQIKITDVDLYSYDRKDYEFSNIGNRKSFRVDKSNESISCSTCNGRKRNTCYSCSGSGKKRCSTCNGRGENRCSSCGGSSEIRCSSCSGSGRVTEYKDNRSYKVSCSSCAGRGFENCSSCSTGYISCTSCSGSGNVDCYSCSGRGEIECQTCNAQGSFTTFYEVESEIKSRFFKSFISGTLDKDYAEKIIVQDIFEYSPDFENYNFKNVIEFKDQIRESYSNIDFQSISSPRKVKFSISECVSLKFSISIGDNLFQGKLVYDGTVTYDKSLLTHLFFNVVNDLKIDEDYESLLSIKTSFINEDEEFKTFFEKVDDYISLKEIIRSSESPESKLNKSRKIKNISVLTYTNNLKKIIRRKFFRHFAFSFFPIYTISIFFFPQWTLLVLGSLFIGTVTTISIIEYNINNQKSNVIKLFQNWILSLSMILIISGIGLYYFESEYPKYPYDQGLFVIDPLGKVEQRKKQLRQIDSLEKEEKVNKTIKSRESFEQEILSRVSSILKQSDLRLFDKLYELTEESFIEYDSKFSSLKVLSKEEFVREYFSKFFETIKSKYTLTSVKELVDKNVMDKDFRFVSNNIEKVYLMNPFIESEKRYYLKKGSYYELPISPYVVDKSSMVYYLNISQEGFDKIRNSIPNQKYGSKRLNDVLQLEINYYAKDIDEEVRTTLWCPFFPDDLDIFIRFLVSKTKFVDQFNNELFNINLVISESKLKNDILKLIRSNKFIDSGNMENEKKIDENKKEDDKLKTPYELQNQLSQEIRNDIENKKYENSKDKIIDEIKRLHANNRMEIELGINLTTERRMDQFNKELLNTLKDRQNRMSVKINRIVHYQPIKGVMVIEYEFKDEDSFTIFLSENPRGKPLVNKKWYEFYNYDLLFSDKYTRKVFLTR